MRFSVYSDEAGPKKIVNGQRRGLTLPLICDSWCGGEGIALHIVYVYVRFCGGVNENTDQIRQLFFLNRERGLLVCSCNRGWILTSFFSSLVIWMCVYAAGVREMGVSGFPFSDLVIERNKNDSSNPLIQKT